MQIHRVPRPASPTDAPHALTVALAHLDALVMTDEYGHPDFASTARQNTVRLHGSEHGETHLWVALPDDVDPEDCPADAALGYASAALPLSENTEKADLYVATHPAHRSQGIGRALLAAITADVQDRGRTTLLAFTFAPGASATGPDAIPALSGSGAIDGRLPAHRWLVAEGYALEQCERPSTLTLNADTLARAERLAADAVAAAPGASDYDLVTWADATPAEHVDGLGWLISRMSTDVPQAGLGLDEEAWDAGRVLAQEQRMRDAGMRWVLTAARHRSTGVLAAFTRIQWSQERASGVWQEETLVLDGHRGHRLGTIVKAANLPWLMARNPDARRVHTWNAAENRWMLAINDALGFTPVGLEGCWKKTA